MNGRVYDYNLGRFLSVDPFIQGVGNSQGINPYSYIMNNPMAGTDPSGYVIDTIWDVANVIYDVGKIAYGAITGDSDMVTEGLIDISVDAAATMVPFVPAGASKATRALGDVSSVSNGASKGVAKSASEKVTDIGSPASKNKLEVGKVESYQDAKKVTGDGTVHRDHMPSKGAAKMRAEELKGGPLTPKEASKVENTMPTMTVPEDVHIAGPTHGVKNTVSQMRTDSSDLAKAASRDANAALSNAKSLGHSQSTVNKIADGAEKIKSLSNAEFDKILESCLDKNCK